MEKPAKKARISSEERFEVKSSEDMAEMMKDYAPKNTSKNTSWAMNVFSSWCSSRNKKVPEEEICPDNLLELCDVEAINYWLSRFVAEVRHQDGKPYPPRTIHQLLCGLQHHMLSMNPTATKFMDQKNPAFRELHNTCDNRYRTLHKEGIGSDVHHAPLITQEEEDQLWSNGVIGTSTPKALQNAVFYYIGKRFCVRGGDEQRQLGPSQFVRSANCYTYYERGSKNITGGIKDLNKENKVVPCPAVPDSNPRCLVYLLDLYLKKLPPFAFEKDVLYCRPKSPTPAAESDSPWYDSIPVGKNTLAAMVKKMCKDAGIEERGNHSLRATGASAMFQAGIPEHVIQKTTGHRSLKSLRCYERVSTDQHEQVSKVLMQQQEPHKDVVAERLSRVAIECSSKGTIFDGFVDCTIHNVTFNVSS